MNLNCEDGEHRVRGDARIYVSNNRLESIVTHAGLTGEELAVAIENYLPVWMTGDELLSVQPTHVRQVWWSNGSTYEGHDTYALEELAVRVVDGVTLDRNGLPVPLPRDGAQSRLVPIEAEKTEG